MRQQAPVKQAGLVLLMCLLFLTALSLLGLSASADSLLQQQLAANLQLTESSKQEAQSSLGWAEQWLLAMPGPAPEICNNACQGFTVHSRGGLAPNPQLQDAAWWQQYGFEVGIDPVTKIPIPGFAGDATSSSYWVIEILHEVPAALDNSSAHTVWYRILARADKPDGQVISVVEGIVRRSWPDTTAASGRVAWRELR